MIKRKISEVEFFASENRFLYKEVLEDFKNTKNINILTFNITKKSSDGLIESLKNLDKNCKINIITNIPNRYHQYYTKKIRENAKKTIDAYIDILNPKNFQPEINTYFNFKNHSKIIMTDNIAYVGSANFSNESENNIEAGIISRDLDFIDYLKSEFFPSKFDESRCYSDNDLLANENEIIQLEEIINDKLEDMEDDIWFEERHGFPEQIRDPYYVSIGDYEELLDIAESFYELVKIICKKFEWKDAEKEFIEPSKNIVNGINKIIEECHSLSEEVDVLDSEDKTVVTARYKEINRIRERLYEKFDKDIETLKINNTGIK